MDFNLDTVHSSEQFFIHNSTEVKSGLDIERGIPKMSAYCRGKPDGAILIADI
jgi:hypothetical protein